MTFGYKVLFCLKYYNSYQNCCLQASTTTVYFGGPICLLPLQTRCMALSLASCQER